MIKTLEVEGFQPTTKQKEIINYCFDDTTKYIIGLFGRQSGKTYTAINIMLKFGLENNDNIIYWVSPTYSQAKKVFDETIQLINNTPLMVHHHKTDLIITLLSGTKLHFKSGERPDNLRGVTLDYLIMDESAFQRDEVWNEILKPATLVRGKKVLFISTPKGKNWFYTITQLGYVDSQYKTIHATSYDSPYITKEELDEARNTLPEHIFRQEILAEFIDDGGEVFTNLNSSATILQYEPYNPNEKYYAGLDFGRTNDYSVLTILNSKGDVVKHYRKRQQSWELIVSEITTILQQYKPATYAEINGVGDPVFELIKKKYPAVQPFLTTNETKSNIIEELIISFNEGKIRIPTDTLNKDLYRELSVFTYEYSTATRKVKYGAPSGFNDDCVISLALSNHSLKKRINYGSYTIR